MREGTNVSIVVRERGKIVTMRDIHNTWTDAGREYLAQLISFATIGPDAPERNAQIKYMGFGMGGINQGDQAMVTSAPLSTVYPIASTPHGTGFTFRHDFTAGLNSIELPVPIHPTTTTDAYANPTGIVWRDTYAYTNDTFPFSSHPAPNVFRFHFTARQRPPTLVPFVHQPPYSGNMYDLLPISETGLFIDDADPDDPFVSPVCYANFDTIQISVDTHLFVTWDVVF